MIIKRDIFKQIEPFVNSQEAIIITGMRRTGKTTTLNYFYDRIDSDNKFYFDLENPYNRRLFDKENYEDIIKNLEFLGIDFTRKTYIFLDEIQFLNSIPSVIKYMIDHYGVKFLITGSASFYLKNLFTESLSGRKYVFEIFPLNFMEFLRFKGSKIRIPEKITREMFSKLKSLYEEYMEFGGFPEVVLKQSKKEKIMSLKDIFASFFSMEVENLGDFRRNDTIRDLIFLLMERAGSKLDIQKLSKELKISRPTVYGYISFLEGVYFIKRIRPLSKGKSTEIRKQPKLYICDTGILNAHVKIDKGRLFENSVFQILREKGEINYYQKKSGTEIDFILDKTYGYETKLSPYYRDIAKLKRIARGINLRTYKIITLSYTDDEIFIYPFQI